MENTFAHRNIHTKGTQKTCFPWNWCLIAAETCKPKIFDSTHKSKSPLPPGGYGTPKFKAGGGYFLGFHLGIRHPGCDLLLGGTTILPVQGVAKAELAHRSRSPPFGWTGTALVSGTAVSRFISFSLVPFLHQLNVSLYAPQGFAPGHRGYG